METIAITFWGGLVSPLFDAAASVLVCDGEGEGRLVRLGEGSLESRAAVLAREGVGVVICGAISADAEAILGKRGMRVFPWVRGAVPEVLDAYRRGAVESETYLMPGCRRRCRRRGGRFGRMQRNHYPGD